MTPVISVASTEFVRVPVFAASAGVPVNPTTYTPQMAFLTGYGPPQLSDWQAATWDSTEVGTYVLQCLVGPTGTVTLTANTYYVWVQIAATPETVIEPAGEVRVF